MAIEDKVDRLMKEAYEHLEAFNLAEAMKIARKLEAINYSGAYEVMALAQQKEGEPELAMRTLEEGLRRAPSVWLLWQLLGNIASDQGLFAKAEEAYRQALLCPGCDRSWVHYNAALALKRQSRLDEALAELEKVSSTELEHDCLALLISLLNEKGRWDESIDLASDLVSTIETCPDPGDDDMRILAQVYSLLAQALWEGRADGASALAAAFRSIELNKADQLAMRIIREVRNKRSDRAKRFKVVVQGRWHKPFEGERRTPGFFTSYEVVADSLAECLEIIKEFEPPAVARSLRIDTAEELPASGDELKGMYWRGGYAFFQGRGKRRS